jgi:putative phosphoesterase
MRLVGLISDTHSLMRAEALAALDGVELILHAGDVGEYRVLKELERIAPVQAVYGNVDDPIFGLPQALDLTLAGLRIHVSHGHELGSPTPPRQLESYSADVIVFGHTHRPLIERHGTTLVVNPGSAGPKRFNLKPSLALLTLDRGTASARLIDVA